MDASLTFKLIKTSYTFVIDTADMRNVYLHNLLKSEGFNVFTFESYVKLQYKVSKNTVYIFAPACRVDAIHLSMIVPDAIVFCVNIEPKVAKNLVQKKVRIIDLFDDEKMVVENAMLTALGAWNIMRKDPLLNVVSLQKKAPLSALILGGGRVGYAMLRVLVDAGLQVSISSKEPQERLRAQAFCSDVYPFGKHEKVLNSIDVIVNTVPSKVLGEAQLQVVKKDVLILDLASGVGGVDFDMAKKLGLNVLHALGIPGKQFPEQAAELIKNRVLGTLLKL